MQAMKSKVAVVTGGRRGIGRAIVVALAHDGWDTVVIDMVDDESTQHTLRLAEDAGRRAAFIRWDIAEAGRAVELCERAVAVFGYVDCLVNNAGVQVIDRTVDVLDTSLPSFDRLVNINLRGTFFLTQAFARYMVEDSTPRGTPRSIITISSSNATHAKTKGAEYCLSKAGVAMMTKLMALRLAPYDVACYDLQPGLIKTALNESMHSVYEPVVSAGLTPMPRWGLPEDVGQTVATLAGGGLRFCTGQSLFIDGGLHIPKSPFESPFVQAAISGDQ